MPIRYTSTGACTWWIFHGWNNRAGTALKAVMKEQGNIALISSSGEESKGRANKHSFVLEGRWERESKSQAWWGDEAVCLWKRGYANEGLREEGQKNGGEREEGVGEGERGQKTKAEGSQSSRSSRRSEVTGGEKRAWTAPEWVKMLGWHFFRKSGVDPVMFVLAAGEVTGLLASGLGKSASKLLSF